MSASRRRYVILDRDGTINVDCHYLSNPDQVELLPGALQGLARMAAMGLGLVVVTNQSGLARGYFDAVRLRAIHARLEALLAEGGVVLDGIFICPHHPGERCRCRKPEPALALEAAALLGFDTGEAFVIGDRASDIALGRDLGAFSILVTNSDGRSVAAAPVVNADAVVTDLDEAATVIERCLGRQPSGTDRARGRQGGVTPPLPR